jgi:alkylhydroperoxidase family enzyme
MATTSTLPYGDLTGTGGGSGMARIPTVDEHDPGTSPEAREFLRSTEDVTGTVFNALRLLANHPKQARALMGFVRSVRKSSDLPRAITELVWITSAIVNGCHY